MPLSLQAKSSQGQEALWYAQALLENIRLGWKKTHTVVHNITEVITVVKSFMVSVQGIDSNKKNKKGKNEKNIKN